MSTYSVFIFLHLILLDLQIKKIYNKITLQFILNWMISWRSWNKESGEIIRNARAILLSKCKFKPNESSQLFDKIFSFITSLKSDWHSSRFSDKIKEKLCRFDAIGHFRFEVGETFLCRVQACFQLRSHVSSGSFKVRDGFVMIAFKFRYNCWLICGEL